jgi:hypothetical protein
MPAPLSPLTKRLRGCCIVVAVIAGCFSGRSLEIVNPVICTKCLDVFIYRVTINIRKARHELSELLLKSSGHLYPHFLCYIRVKHPVRRRLLSRQVLLDVIIV